MAFDAPAPDPPSLHGSQTSGDYEAIDNELVEEGEDYRREEVAAVLDQGAWEDAFEEWSRQSGLSSEEFAVVVDHGLIDAFDFYWDPASDQVGYQAPTLPDEITDEFADPGEADMELDTLGRIVSEVLENDYLRRDENDFGFFADEDESYGDREN